MSVVSCMWGRQRSLDERPQEHDNSVKEGDSESAHSQHQVMTGRKVLSKPIIEGVRVIVSLGTCTGAGLY